MKKLLLRALRLLFLVLFPGLAMAQQNPDYAVLLNSGKFTPPENGKTISLNSDIFRNSSFGDKYYVTLQFKKLPTQQEKERLAAAGIQLSDYIPNLAYTAVLQKSIAPAQLRSFPIRSIFRLNAQQKTVPVLLQKVFPAHAVKQKGFVDVTVLTYEKLPAETVGKALQKVDARILEVLPQFRSFTVRVAQHKIKNLIDLPFIQWVEPIDAPNVQENLLGRTLHRVNVLNDGVRNLKGDGINVGIWDGGEVSPHLDFSPIATRLTLVETSQPESHATHVAGTIAGRGIINYKARGMAPNAKIYSYNFSGNIPSEMSAAIPALNLAISSHSYGSTQTCGLNGAGVAYSSTSRNTDLNLNNNPSHLHVHSAGNSQSACSGGWSTITGSGKTAKNNILVANITSSESMSNSSSFGPVADGRVKPEISALGTNVLSTYTPLNSYATISGTSMATPGISGSVALVVERYKQLNGNVAPISSLIKGVVCNTAQDLGNPGPDYKFGFGRINALAAVKSLEQNRYVINNVATGATNDITLTVPANAKRMKVMLTWNDPAGTVNANPALVNNLNLSVINATTTTLPWILNPNNPGSAATRGTDNVSNIEQVTIDNPAAGTYTLRVTGAAVPTGANQQYALTWEVTEPFIEVIYPNGGEAFEPGKQETITWDNAGVTGNQTIQYSVNNGTTWTTISSTISANTTRYNWTVPTGLNTATALIKITSGTLTDQSDATFRILGIPVNLTASAGLCAGSLNFSWSAVTNATHYDLFSLNNTTGEWQILAADIAGTSYVATGLTPNANMWFTLKAKNNLLGSVSERATAINRTVPSSGSLTLGNISGLNSICSGTQNVTYSVPAAAGVSTYTWTIPTGVTLVSGQGTNTIVVNYPASVISGNITVTGSSGTCQSSTQTLAVSAGNTVPAPLSNGNLTACDYSPTPVLTASATAPAGYSIVWYSAPTGGTVVTDPNLTAPGTVTYYAASRSTSGNCESATRTPVTLTINAVPAAIITATRTTICAGGEATLTASQGSSYFWSTGATSQSIKVTQPGNYTVTVTQASGCASSSVPTTITISPNPEVNLSAAPYTKLHPGLSTTLTANTQASGNITYTWFKNGTVIPGATGATLPVSVDELGDYSVDISTSEGCAATSNKLAITDSVSNFVFIYPNPNNGVFQIRFHNESGVTSKYNLVVYDAKGAKVFLQNNSIKQSYEKLEVDMSHFGSGVYWLLLQNEQGKKVGSGRVVID